MPLEKTIGGGGNIAPAIISTLDTSISDYVPTLREGYSFDPYYGKWLPDSIALRPGLVVNVDESSSKYLGFTPQAGGHNTMLATDGTMLCVSMADSDNNSNTSKRFVWAFARPGVDSQMFFGGSIPATLVQPATVSALRMSRPLKVAENTWVMTYGDTDSYRVAKIIYDTGTGQATLSVSSDQRTSIGNVDHGYYDLIDNGDGTFFVFIPTNSDLLWDAWDVSALTRDFFGSLGVAVTPRKSIDKGGDLDGHYGSIAPMSDGRLFFNGSTTTAIFEWNGATFVSGGASSITNGTGPIAKLSEDVWVQFELSGTTLTWDVFEYDPGTNTANYLVQESYVDRSGVNLSNLTSMGRIGQNGFYVAIGTSFLTVKFDPSNYELDINTLQTFGSNDAEAAKLRGFYWDQDGYGYFFDAFSHTTPDNGYMIGSVFRVGAVIPNGALIRAGYLEAFSGGSETIRVSVSNVQTNGDFVLGGIYDDLVAVSDSVALRMRQLPSVVQRITYTPTLGVGEGSFAALAFSEGANLLFDDEYPLGGTIPSDKEKLTTMQLLGFNDSGAAGELMLVVSLDGFMVKENKINMDNTDTNVPYYRVSSANIIGIYGCSPDNSGELKGYFEAETA